VLLSQGYLEFGGELAPDTCGPMDYVIEYQEGFEREDITISDFLWVEGIDDAYPNLAFQSEAPEHEGVHEVQLTFFLKDYPEIRSPPEKLSVELVKVDPTVVNILPYLRTPLPDTLEINFGEVTEVDLKGVDPEGEEVKVTLSEIDT